MKALLQRVKHASVSVDNKLIAQIDHGLLVFLGVEKGDTPENMQTLADNILNYRMFNDPDGKMNLDIKQVDGKILLVSQFTLVANTKRGRRPSFTDAAPPQNARMLYNHMADYIVEKLGHVQTGKFAADMKVELLNDGPVTFMLES